MSTDPGRPPTPVLVTRPQTSVLGILSLVFGLVFVLAPLGVVLGIVAISQMNRTPHRYSGRGIAIAGTAVSALGALILAGLAATALRTPTRTAGRRPSPAASAQDSDSIVGVFRRARASAKKHECLSHMKNLALAAQMWASDHGNRLPDADRWVDELLSYGARPETFRCATDPSGARSSYGMNAALSGADITAIPDPEQVVLFYETAHPGDNPSGGSEDVVRDCHQGGSNYAFVKGLSRWVGSDEQVSFGGP